MMRIAILAALPQEYRPFQRLFRTWRPLFWQPFRVFFHRTASCELFLVETGMGNHQAEKAARHAFGMAPLDLIVSTGFAGSLCRDLPVGQVVCARDLAVWATSASIPVVDRFHISTPARLASFCEAQDILSARVLTLERPHPKTVLTRHTGTIPTVVDMESVLVAEMAYRRGIAFLCLRAVSDALTDEIAWDLDAVADSKGRVRIPKVLTALLRKPALLASFYRLWRNSREAGQHLAQALTAVLRFPDHDLQALIRGLQLLPASPIGPQQPGYKGNPSDGVEPRTR
jgi:nucleoside phosphorylase